MDHLEVLREKIERLRTEISEIRLLNERHRLGGENGTEAQVAHGQRHERLQAIQRELAQLSAFGRKTFEDRMESHLSRVRPVKRAS
jgi:hypothetical protein